jgi:predicted amidohydrolase
MKVAAIQHDIVWEDPAANFARLAPLLGHAADAGARLALLTEMYSTGFSMHTERTAEPVDGPSTGFLVDQATSRGMWVGGSIPECEPGADKPSNTFVLAAPDGAVHRYRKIHPFTYSGEHERYDAGDAFTTVDVDGVRCSLFVCYDLRFADEFWSLAEATDCYLVPANWPASRREHWRTLLRARAIENLAYVVGVNRVGTGGRLEYVGDSAVIGPVGEELATGDGRGEAVLVADVDPAHVAATRQRLGFLADRR